ncbi:uncharacterized protein F4822DRAFT_417939 [Hypoxylon trugodes]|uniref:uncharacterized protein n=1 Tax=Hypoxylon trugodes TaxID=326681 RepID=UPI0021917ED6|nr:uncharacterized protein F4822DRAFT_417939 [Hypoxylon trugodes]KAI1383895.1 hypothetical protein F4822DRAFT_417939 [Hypoxylon trugodes]
MRKSIITTLLLAAVSAMPSSILHHRHHRHRHMVTRRDPGNCSTQAQDANSDADSGGPGLKITNGDTQSRCFFAYENSCDEIPLKYISIGIGETKFLSLPSSFQGRIVRGAENVNLDGSPHLLGTWLEITFDNSQKGYADVSLIRGCDGAVTVASLDGSGANTGFNDEGILIGAPEAAYAVNDEGVKVIAATEGQQSVVVPAPRDYLVSKIGYGKAYIDDYHDNPVICSSNRRFGATFYQGAP